MRGTRFASGGTSEYSTVATTSRPAPAAKSISVPPGERLTIRSGGGRTVTARPSSSVTMRAAPAATQTAAATASRASAERSWGAGRLMAACDHDTRARPGSARASPRARSRLRGARLGERRLPARPFEHPRHRVHGRGDAHRALHRLALESVLAHLALVRGDAGPAAVDGRHGERQQLEIDLGNAGIAEHVHAQSRRELRVLTVLHHMEEAVVDIVHAHD